MLCGTGDETSHMSWNAPRSLGFAALLLALAAGCGGSQPVIVPPLDPMQDVLLWTIDGEGLTATHWLRGNRQGGNLVASRTGIVLALPTGLYEIREREVELATCDCAAWEESGREGACPAGEAGSIGVALVAIRQPDGEEIPIAGPAQTQGEDGPIYGALESVAAVAASVGPFLFVRVDTRGTVCGESHETWSADFSVFDLTTGAPVELLTPEERARVLGREQAAAFKMFEGDNLARAARPEDLELTMMMPVLVPGAGITLRYQFSASSSFNASDGTWGAYTRSVDVLAAEVPAAIAPYSPIPPALVKFPIPGEGLAIGGFSPISATGEELAALERLFSFEP